MTSKIEWLRSADGRPGYTINPVRGRCPNPDCPLGESCYARRLYKRFKWNPEIRFDLAVANALAKIKKPSRIFWGSTMELFGDWINPEWMRLIMEATKRHSEHTHIFLTKQPQNLIKWSPFPDNYWVGVSATNNQMYREAIYNLAHIKAKVKYISFEPLLENIKVNTFNDFINWVIIGACTPYSVKTAPKIEWVREIVEAADKAEIPVFQKNNLRTLLGDNLRQEFPAPTKGESE